MFYLGPLNVHVSSYYLSMCRLGPLNVHVSPYCRRRACTNAGDGPHFDAASKLEALLGTPVPGNGQPRGHHCAHAWLWAAVANHRRSAVTADRCLVACFLGSRPPLPLPGRARVVFAHDRGIFQSSSKQSLRGPRLVRQAACLTKSWDA